MVGVTGCSRLCYALAKKHPQVIPLPPAPIPSITHQKWSAFPTPFSHLAGKAGGLDIEGGRVKARRLPRKASWCVCPRKKTSHHWNVQNGPSPNRGEWRCGKWAASTKCLASVQLAALLVGRRVLPSNPTNACSSAWACQWSQFANHDYILQNNHTVKVALDRLRHIVKLHCQLRVRPSVA